MDPADRADEESTNLLEDALGAVQRKAAKIPAGEAGVCELCDEDKPRLVPVYYAKWNRNVKACAGCRDHFKLG